MGDPDLAQMMTNPKVVAAIAECTKNPMAIFQYQNDPEVGAQVPFINKEGKRGEVEASSSGSFLVCGLGMGARASFQYQNNPEEGAGCCREGVKLGGWGIYFMICAESGCRGKGQLPGPERPRGGLYCRVVVLRCGC
jgi:hypothetical protein